jgi:arylsulfatase A-like enzyme
VREPGTAQAPAKKSPVPNGPNVLLIMWDTVRADRMSLYGHSRPTTPNLDEFAKQAVVYERAISPGNWTVPSHASLFTGLPVSAHGTTSHHEWLSNDHTTLAEALAGAGYDTYAFTANPHISASTNLLQGFDVVETSWRGRWLPACREATMAKLIREDRSTKISPSYPRLRARPGNEVYKDCGERTAEALLRWVDDRREPRRPFFAYLNYMEVHVPRVPREETRQRIMASARLAPALRLNQTSMRQFLHMFGFQPYSAEDLAVMAEVYDASLADLDAATRSLFHGLRQRGTLDETVVILTSDHGEHLGEHGQLDHKYSIYDPLVWVPLVVRYPRRFPAGRVDVPVSVRDVPATILELAGLPANDAPGSYPLPLPGSASIPRRAAHAEAIAPVTRALQRVSKLHPSFDWKPWLRQMRSIEREGYKLISVSDGTAELYDISADPGELRDLTSVDPDRAGDMRAELEAWLTSFPHFQPGAHPDAHRAPPLDPAVEEQLRALGYLDDGPPEPAPEQP